MQTFRGESGRGLRTRAASTDGRETDPRQSPAARTARRRWAALIKRIWQVDPLIRTRCGGHMKIISLINPWQRDVIDRILTHGGLSSGAPPSDARVPPVAPIRQLTCVRDLEFADDPARAEPVWSAD
ncbi:MAG: hypothetical protein ACYTGF_13075 [Planctomycetota bacterium]